MADYLVIALAVWRLSSLLVNELGPYVILERLRNKVGVKIEPNTLIPYGSNQFAELFVCVWCMSFWIGIIAWISYLLNARLTVIIAIPLALSAGAIVIERIVRETR